MKIFCKIAKTPLLNLKINLPRVLHNRIPRAGHLRLHGGMGVHRRVHRRVSRWPVLRIQVSHVLHPLIMHSLRPAHSTVIHGLSHCRLHVIIGIWDHRVCPSRHRRHSGLRQWHALHLLCQLLNRHWQLIEINWRYHLLTGVYRLTVTRRVGGEIGSVSADARVFRGIRGDSW